MPRTFVAISFRLKRVLDLTDGSVRQKLSVSLKRILDTGWRAEMDAGVMPLTQLLGQAATAAGLEGLLVPSKIYGILAAGPDHIHHDLPELPDIAGPVILHEDFPGLGGLMGNSLTRNMTEIPELEDYDLVTVEIQADENLHWQTPDAELEKLSSIWSTELPAFNALAREHEVDRVILEESQAAE